MYGRKHSSYKSDKFLFVLGLIKNNNNVILLNIVINAHGKNNVSHLSQYPIIWIVFKIASSWKWKVKVMNFRKCTKILDSHFNRALKAYWNWKYDFDLKVSEG